MRETLFSYGVQYIDVRVYTIVVLMFKSVHPMGVYGRILRVCCAVVARGVICGHFKNPLGASGPSVSLYEFDRQ